jgi:hypothetical protein
MYMVICISCFEIRLGRYSRRADWQWLNSLRYRDMSSDNYIHEKKKQPQKRMPFVRSRPHQRVAPHAAAPTSGETWSTEALVNLSNTEHALSVTRSCEKILPLTIAGHSGQLNRCRVSNMRLYSQQASRLSRHTTFQDEMTEGSCSVKLRVVRYQTEAQHFRSHQAQKGQGSLPSCRTGGCRLSTIDIIAFLDRSLQR